jgi:hypothetical protein
MSIFLTQRFHTLLGIVFALLIGIVLVEPSNPMENLPGQDNGVFLYAGQQILAGEVPYLDFWDHKGPLIFYINALGLMLVSGSRWGVWLVELLFLILSAIGLHQISRYKWGNIAGICTLLLWFFFMQQVGSYNHFGDSNYVESYGLIFTSWAILFWLWSQNEKAPMIWCFFIGVMAGLSFSLRPNNIAVHITFLLFECAAILGAGNKIRHVKRVGFILGGWGCVVLLMGVVLWMNGSLSEMADAVFVYNAIYSAKNASVKNVFLVMKSGLDNFYWIPLLACVGLTGWVAYSRFFENARNFFGHQFTLFLMIGFMAEVVLSSISGRVLLHYFISWVPVVVLLTTCFLFTLVRIPKAFPAYNNEKFASYFPFLVVILYLFWHAPVLGKYPLMMKYVSEHGRLEPEKAMIEFIHGNTTAEDTVLVWGNEVWINFLTERKSPGKYAYQYPLFMPGYTNEEMVASFLQELMICPPVYLIEPLVDTDEILPYDQQRRSLIGRSIPPLPEGMDEVFEYFQDHYVYVREFNDVIIYKWNGREDADRDCPKR